MIVYLNVEKENVEVFSEQGKKVYFFDEIDFLLDDIGNKQCRYVTNIMDTDIKTVIDTVKSIKPNASLSGSLDDMDSNVNFLHSTTPGVLNISVGDGVISFYGVGDCKILDERLYAMIKDSFDLRQMIKQGRLEIITETEMRKYVRVSTREQAKKDRKWAQKEAKEIDSIIVNNDVPGSALDAVENMFTGNSDPDDIVVVDLNEGSTPAGQTPRQITDEDIRSGRVDPGELV